MLNDILVSLVAPIVSAFVAAFVVLIIGYYIFRNDQRNKNKAVDTRFETVDKNVAKNDERIRDDFVQQNERNDKAIGRLERQIIQQNEVQIEQGKAILTNQLSVVNIGKTMDNLSTKLDVIIETLVRQTNEQS